MTAAHALLRAAVLGIGGASLVSLSPTRAWAATPGPSTPLVLECLVSGGGYAIKDVKGQTLENGDGVPFSPRPRAVLHVTAAPRRVQVTEGVLPHPDCSSGPVLDSLTPLRFTWCRARYEITPREAGRYRLVSTSTSVLTAGPHRGDLMEAFVAGTCTLVSAPGPR